MSKMRNISNTLMGVLAVGASISAAVFSWQHEYVAGGVWLCASLLGVIISELRG